MFRVTLHLAAQLEDKYAIQTHNYLRIQYTSLLLKLLEMTNDMQMIFIVEKKRMLKKLHIYSEQKSSGRSVQWFFANYLCKCEFMFF